MSRARSFYDDIQGQNREDSDEGEFIPNLVIVLMPFSGEGMKETYQTIKEECQKLHLDAKRVDEFIGSGLIITQISKSIEDAEFIICDLSYEKPNVYYELGYAHGIGNSQLDILLIAKENTKVHFDLASLRIKYYSSIEDLRIILRENLAEMIRITRGE